jgi:hypothetical protein
MSSIKGLSAPDGHLDGSGLRIAIVHARWNKQVIDALVAGALAKLKACGVKDSHIVVQSVPGSFELPLACSKYVYPIAPSKSLTTRTGSSLPHACRPARPRPTCWAD